MDNVEGKAPPPKQTPKRKPTPTPAVNMLSSEEAPTPKPTPKRKPKPKTAVNVPDGEAPQEEPKKKLLNQGRSLKPPLMYQRGTLLKKRN